MSLRNKFFPFVCVCIFFSASLIVQAQTVTGTIVGTVADATGAVLPGVTVVVTNMATNVKHTVVTNDAGQYVVPFLSPGEYSVAAELPGFKKRVISNVLVQVEQRIRIDMILEVGEITEVVEVTGQTPLVNSENASIGQVIEIDLTQKYRSNGKC